MTDNAQETASLQADRTKRFIAHLEHLPKEEQESLQLLLYNLASARTLPDYREQAAQLMAAWMGLPDDPNAIALAHELRRLNTIDQRMLPGLTKLMGTMIDIGEMKTAELAARGNDGRES